MIYYQSLLLIWIGNVIAIPNIITDVSGSNKLYGFAVAFCVLFPFAILIGGISRYYYLKSRGRLA